MPEHSFIIKGDICHSLAPGELECAGGAPVLTDEIGSAGAFQLSRGEAVADVALYYEAVFRHRV